MEKVIEVLKEKIINCETMKNWYDQELLKHQRVTSDKTEFQRLKICQQENIDIYNKCLIAVEQLKNK